MDKVSGYMANIDVAHRGPDVEDAVRLVVGQVVEALPGEEMSIQVTRNHVNFELGGLGMVLKSPALPDAVDTTFIARTLGILAEKASHVAVSATDGPDGGWLAIRWPIDRDQVRVRSTIIVVTPTLAETLELARERFWKGDE